jgi:hypothetical protein
MFKKVVAIASVTALLATATPALAHERHGHGHSDNAAGLLAFGAIAGALIGTAILAQHHDEPPPVAYAPPPAYYPAPPAYYAPAPAYYGAPGYYGYGR